MLGNISEWISVITNVITAVIGGIVVVKYNRHTKKTEDTEINVLNLEGKQAFLEEYRAQSAIVVEVMRSISDISDIVKKLHNSGKENLNVHEERTLRDVVINADSVIQLVRMQLIPIDEWLKFFPEKKHDDLRGRLDISENLGEHLRILYDFVARAEEYAENTKSNNLKSIRNVTNSGTYDYFKDDDLRPVLEYKNENSDELVTVLMVALRRDEKLWNSWLKQSLGNWRISSKRKHEIQYIVGINVETRNLVSIAKVTFSSDVEDRVRFEKVEESGLEQSYERKDEKELKIIDEAIYWNARNPVKYIYRTEKEIEDLKKHLAEESNK